MPVITTFSLNKIAIGITLPTSYTLSAAVDETDETRGPNPSITNALLADSEPVAPGVESVSVASFPDASRMVPLFTSNASTLT